MWWTAYPERIQLLDSLVEYGETIKRGRTLNPVKELAVSVRLMYHYDVRCFCQTWFLNIEEQTPSTGTYIINSG
jgi:hypothetical protein